MTPENLFSESHYGDVRRPLTEASCLPSWCYTSERFHQRELERIFLKCWHFVGREDEITEAGDYLTFEAAGGPVIVMRDDDDVVRAFYNTCRHRGTQLLTGNGQAPRIVCPYHSWVYGTDGRLQRAPGMQGVVEFRAQAHALAPVRLEIWAGFMFVCYAAEAPTLAEYLGDFPEFFSAYRPQELVCVRRVNFEIKANWKLLIENALEAYHTGTVHAQTLGRQQSKPVVTRGNWGALFGYVDGDSSMAVLPGTTPALPHIPGLSGDQVRGTYFTDIYLCTQFVFAQDCMWWLAVQPDGVDNCHVVLGSCFPESTTRLAHFESALESYYERWDRATPEDNAIAEAQQSGQRAGVGPPGRFSNEEFVVHELANWVLDQVME